MSNIRRLSVFKQAGSIRNLYPDSKLKFIGHGNGLIWEGYLKPSILSLTYRIRIEFKVGSNPDVYVINPIQLRLASGQSILPHIYDHEKQQLCIYTRRLEEWNENRLIVKTIIPWTSEWLLHYETWVATGEWFGGGYH